MIERNYTAPPLRRPEDGLELAIVATSIATVSLFLPIMALHASVAEVHMGLVIAIGASQFYVPVFVTIVLLLTFAITRAARRSRSRGRKRATIVLCAITSLLLIASIAMFLYATRGMPIFMFLL